MANGHHHVVHPLSPATSIVTTPLPLQHQSACPALATMVNGRTHTGVGLLADSRATENPIETLSFVSADNPRSSTCPEITRSYRAGLLLVTNPRVQ